MMPFTSRRAPRSGANGVSRDQKMRNDLCVEHEASNFSNLIRAGTVPLRIAWIKFLMKCWGQFFSLIVNEKDPLDIRHGRTSINRHQD